MSISDIAARQEQSIGAAMLFFQDFEELVNDLGTRAPSALAALNRSYPRHLVIAAASSLESMVKLLLPDIFRRLGREEFGVFIEKNVMARGYHQLFDWDSEKAVKLFAMFGADCKKHFMDRLVVDEDLADQHAAFMRIGSVRNQLVHNDYSTFQVDMTPAEVQAKFLLATRFVLQIEPLILRTD